MMTRDKAYRRSIATTLTPDELAKMREVAARLGTRSIHFATAIIRYALANEELYTQAAQSTTSNTHPT